MSDLNEDNGQLPTALFQSINNDNQEEYMNILHLLKYSLLAEQYVDCIGNVPQTNFEQHISATEINISKALSLFVSTDASISVPKDIILYVILLSGENSENENWTSSQIQCLVNQFRETILVRTSCKDVTDILLLYKVNYFLNELKPKLLSSNWKKYPAAVVCFSWILHHIKFPHLGDNIGSILPPCLLLIDDHINSNKIKGLKCLAHVTRNVSRTDLLQYGRGDVIYSAVEHMIYSRDSEIIPPLSSFLIAFLSKTEHSFTTNSLVWTRFDDVLNIWLPSMEMEQSLVLRETYIDSLTSLLKAMGISSVRWSARLLRVISEYTEQGHTLDKALMCLQMFIKTTWPKISSNAYKICLILMKVTIRLYNKIAATEPSEITEKILKECFYSLKELSDKEFDSLFSELIKSHEMNKVFKYIIEENY